MDQGAWQAAVHGVAQSRARLKRLSSSSSSQIFIIFIDLFNKNDFGAIYFLSSKVFYLIPLVSSLIFISFLLLTLDLPSVQFIHSVVSDSLQPHELQPARLHCSWNSSGKNTGVGSHFLLQGICLTQRLNLGLPPCRQVFYHLSYQGSPAGCLLGAAAAKLLQSCPTLSDPIDGSPPGSPVPGTLRARTLEWVAISFSNA